ncbi:MAG: hypothetical protein ACRC6N_11175 [Plesiomonas sp.]|uniref:hypothetical protein n=1 Tax=Plesiomonas sp. TaxID=2486279 RepID=UPI003F33899B
MQPETEALALTLVFSVISGIGVYFQGVREKRISGGRLDLLSELITSASGGLIAYYIALHYSWDEPLLFLAVIGASNNGREIVTRVKDKVIRALDLLSGGKKE